MFVNTQGLTRAQVLLALYLYAVRNETEEVVFGYSARKPNLSHAERLVAEVYPRYQFDTVFMNFLTVTLDLDLTDPDGFESFAVDYNIGCGASRAVIKSLRDQLQIPEPKVETIQPPFSPINRYYDTVGNSGSSSPGKMLEAFRSLSVKVPSLSKKFSSSQSTSPNSPNSTNSFGMPLTLPPPLIDASFESMPSTPGSSTPRFSGLWPKKKMVS